MNDEKGCWRETAPTRGLTWGQDIVGDDFANRLDALGCFGQDVRLLEIGPGYGRVLKSMLEKCVLFDSYLGIDLSEKNIQYLRSNFGAPGIDFFIGDAEIFSHAELFDVVFSSLTFKHFHPDCKKAIANLKKLIEDDGKLVFDFWHGTDNADMRGHWESCNCFLKPYATYEIEAILVECGFVVQSFGFVQHGDKTRDLVCATKKG